jgi:hypothetical protein
LRAARNPVLACGVKRTFTPWSERRAIDPHFDMGLGFMLRDEDGELSLMYGGSNQPGFVSLLVAMPDRGQGVVVMTNGENGHPLATEILHSVIDEYGWPDATE